MEPKIRYPGTGFEPPNFDNTCKIVLDGASDDFEPEWEWNSADHRGTGFGKIDAEKVPLVSFNHIDYLPERDHILVSCNTCNEIYIIDHKPNTVMSSGEQGDLLWRFGRPSNYGGPGEAQLGFTHSTHWVYNKDTYGWSGFHNDDVGDIILLNNRDPKLCPEPCTTGREGFSSVVQLTPPWNDEFHRYDLLPTDFKLRITEFEHDGTMYDIDSDFQGHAQLLPHGRIQLAIGGPNNNDSTGRAQGDIYELETDGTTTTSVWRYVNPFVPPEEFWGQNNGPKPEDIELPPSEPVSICDQNNLGFKCNALFRGIKYAPDFDGIKQLGLPGSDCQPPHQCPLLNCDFSTLSVGVALDDDAQAQKLLDDCLMTVTATNTIAGNVLNIFNSSMFASEDPDLGSPNRACPGGGPGKGKGGKPKSPWPNCDAQGNLLIIQNENKPPSTPNDSANGGCFIFNWTVSVSLLKLGILDVDENTAATITIIVSDYNEVSFDSPSNIGDNGLWIADEAAGLGELSDIHMMKICLTWLWSHLFY